MAQHPLKALLLKPAANAGWKWERLEVASCIAALCWNKSVEQRSASYVSQELAQTAATGLHCSPTGQGKKGLKGLCISGHYVSAHAAHVNLLHFLTLLHSAFHLGSPRPSGHKWSVFVLFFFTFPLQVVFQLLQKWQFSCHKVMAGCGKSPHDDAVRPPGLRTVVTSSICQARHGIAAQTVDQTDLNLTDFSRRDRCL